MSTKVISLIIPRERRMVIMTFAPLTISSGITGRRLRNLENSGLGLRICVVFRTPSEDINENGWVVAQAKKAVSIRLDTTGDGVEGWNVKNLSM